MNVTEARRTRHLVVRLDRGDELPAALVRALNELSAHAAWITGAGAVEAAEVVLYDQRARAYGKVRRIDTPAQIVALTGSAAIAEGALTLQLSATLARETDVGLETIAGELVWARAFAVELHVVVFDDLAFTRVLDERTGLAILDVRSTLPGAAAPTFTSAPPIAAPPVAAPPVAAPQVAAAPPAEPPRAPLITPPPAPPPPHAEPPARPQTAPGATEVPRPIRPAPREDVETYPEVGDLVSHFHFGECTVLSSDGDRIRLRQDKDGRVREVALAMLRIEAPTITPDGKRHFRLQRKH